MAYRIALIAGASSGIGEAIERTNMQAPHVARIDEPEEVARTALASIGRRPVQRVGSQGHVAAGLARFLPRRFVLAAMSLIAENRG